MNEHTMMVIRKYSPKSFLDIEGRCIETVNTLRTYIALDKIHIVLIGGEGCGKTVWLDLIIKEYYIQYSKEVYSPNVLRINAVYDQGIQYFRTEVKNFCQTCSTVADKKKMLVVDDIDGLPESSQHILASIIDKHKSKIQVISSCTNIYKLITNIQSRLMLIDMPLISNSYLNSIARRIVADYTLTIEEPEIEHLITVSHNRINQMLQYFEKIILYGLPITSENIHYICEHINTHIFETYLGYLKDNNLQMAIVQVYSLYDKGFSVIDILDSFFAYIKLTTVISDTYKYEIIELICKYINIFYTIHEDEIELALFTNDIMRRFHETLGGPHNAIS